jgi:hypothetical protein
MTRKGLITCMIAGALTAGIANAKVHVYVGSGPPAPIVDRRRQCQARATFGRPDAITGTAVRMFGQIGLGNPARPLLVPLQEFACKS